MLNPDTVLILLIVMILLLLFYTFNLYYDVIKLLKLDKTDSKS